MRQLASTIIMDAACLAESLSFEVYNKVRHYTLYFVSSRLQLKYPRSTVQYL